MDGPKKRGDLVFWKPIAFYRTIMSSNINDSQNMLSFLVPSGVSNIAEALPTNRSPGRVNTIRTLTSLPCLLAKFPILSHNPNKKLTSNLITQLHFAPIMQTRNEKQGSIPPSPYKSHGRNIAQTQYEALDVQTSIGTNSTI